MDVALFWLALLGEPAEEQFRRFASHHLRVLINGRKRRSEKIGEAVVPDPGDRDIVWNPQACLLQNA
jgi:hypothetical protein